jgi:hypothetical protein
LITPLPPKTRFIADGVLTTTPWFKVLTFFHHFTALCRIFSHRSHNLFISLFFQVNLTLNGYQQRTVILEYPTMQISPTSVTVLVGHRLPRSEVVMQNSPGWQLGNIMMFKGKENKNNNEGSH